MHVRQSQSWGQRPLPQSTRISQHPSRQPKVTTTASHELSAAFDPPSHSWAVAATNHLSAEYTWEKRGLPAPPKDLLQQICQIITPLCCSCWYVKYTISSKSGRCNIFCLQDVTMSYQCVCVTILVPQECLKLPWLPTWLNMIQDGWKKAVIWALSQAAKVRLFTQLTITKG